MRRKIEMVKVHFDWEKVISEKKKNPENELPFPLNSVGVGGDEIQHQNMKNKNHPFQLLNITFDENYKRSSEIVVN